MSEVSQFESQIKNLQPAVDRKALLMKLERNRDFQKFIELFTIEDCARYMHESMDLCLTEEQRNAALTMSRGAGALVQWIANAILIGTQHENSISQYKEAIEEIRQSGEDEDGE